MKEIDWEKVRRERNVWKPDYREGFRESRAQLTDPILNSRPPGNRYYFVQPRSAREIKSRLSFSGLKGSELRKFVDAILLGEEVFEWVEYELQSQRLIAAGFEPLPIEIKGGLMKTRFVKRNQTGLVEDEAMFTFRKNISHFTWNDVLAEHCRTEIFAGRSITGAIAKIAPKGFIIELRKQLRADMLARFAEPNQKEIKPRPKRPINPKALKREQIAEELGIKQTDAMLWKVPGSYGSSQR